MNRKSLHEYWQSSLLPDSPLKNYVQFRAQTSQALKDKKAFSAEPLIDITVLQKTIEKELEKWMNKKN